MEVERSACANRLSALCLYVSKRIYLNVKILFTTESDKQSFVKLLLFHKEAKVYLQTYYVRQAFLTTFVLTDPFFGISSNHSIVMFSRRIYYMDSI